MGNLLIAKGLIVTRCIGFSEGSSSLPIANVPPGIDTISGINCASIGAIALIADELSLGLSSGTCAGAGTDEPSFGVSTGTGAGAGTGCGFLAVSPGVPGVCCVPAGVGARRPARPGTAVQSFLVW